MASQLKNTMDLSFESYDGAPHGGCMLDDQFSMHWEPDVSGDVINEAGFGPVNVNKLAPGSVVCKAAAIAEQTVKLFDHWAGHETLQQLFDGLHAPETGFDIESFVCGSEVQAAGLKQEQPEPVFDAFSTFHVDSLFSSIKDVSSSACSQSNVHENVISMLPEKYSGDQQSLKDVSSPGSPDSGISSAGSPQSFCSDESFVGSQEIVGSPDRAYPENLDTYEDPPVLHVVHPAVSQPSLDKPKNENVPQCVELPTVSSEDLAFLESLWCDGEFPVEGVKPALTLGSESVLTAVVIQDSPTRTIATPKPVEAPSKSVRTKALTLSEKKERKRAQNKNAATRYREKKRTEAQTIYEDQTKLEDQNKGLHDKVTLISREIQYMKELLIEVYRTKGLIE